MLVVFILEKLIKVIEKKRYLDSDELTKEQQKLLENDPGVIVEGCDKYGKTYSLVGYCYK